MLEIRGGATPDDLLKLRHAGYTIRGDGSLFPDGRQVAKVHEIRTDGSIFPDGRRVITVEVEGTVAQAVQALALVPARTRAYRVETTRGARAEAEKLVLESRWFVMTPLPDDSFEFIVKDE